ncbi:EF-hand calcium-binding domain-containing protein 4B-like isoform X3 [Dreissena polymorpha]|uniref:EF-hand calcium-binding domain-containing protein 4B-like isoform X3 n=1 Tax=Dreissena polymorpha TaxID=45954 RepID=UPI0022646132|nr:EF-hand calcium-binding domain-containing protein 4B-like isoform X3 [Dreissena polymorpha]
MSSYTEHLDEEDEGDLNPSSSEMQRLMNEKAHELFQVCDTEKKGFITKRDMQRLQSELPLSPEQLEHVFDSLDVDGNGFLSLEEFTDGFGGFLGLRSTSDGAMDNDATYMDESGVDPHEEEQNFHTMMEHLGVTNIVEGDSTVKSLWCRLRKDDTGMASTFEDFLFRVSNEIRKSKCEFDSLEDALKSKTNAHDEEVRKLYEEMEVQIKQEKEKILAEERSKERQLREAMEQEIMEKDKQLQEIVSRHSEMEEKLGFLNTVEAETKIEKEKLAKEKEDLEESFHRSQQALAECQAYINQLRQQQKEDKRERAKAALKLSEGIALERETLVNQLEKLKTMNRQLQDEKDEAVLRRQSDDNARSERAVPRRAELERQGSSLGKYFDTNRAPKSSRTESIKEDIAEEAIGSNFDEEFEDEDVECDDEVYMIANQTPSFIHHTVKDNYSPGKQPLHSSPIVRQHGDNSRVADFDEDSRVVDSRNAGTKNYDANPNDFNVESESDLHTPDSPRTQPVGADELTDSGIQSTVETTALQRIFKVVFVGDSGVGKSSFIHRFCTDNFRPSFSATIGVDFQIKSLPIEGQLIVLQLWDTAGQERFRSITKQYFRKADGVVIMYDVNSEVTFTNVRNWMISVKEGASEDAVLLLLGNKCDMAEDDYCKVVKMKCGSHLADEYGTLFYETSALNGECVKEAMEAMARVLKEKEDKEIEKSFKLDDVQPKKKCCPI